MSKYYSITQKGEKYFEEFYSSYSKISAAAQKVLNGEN